MHRARRGLKDWNVPNEVWNDWIMFNIYAIVPKAWLTPQLVYATKNKKIVLIDCDQSVSCVDEV